MLVYLLINVLLFLDWAKAAYDTGVKVAGLSNFIPIAKVRKMPSWPRSWANFSLLQLYSHRNAWGQLASSGPTRHLSR
jgi:hypothetical protein